VLRHEFTHTVDARRDDNRIAHWMTEGPGVVQEKSPLRWEWVPMLNDAVKKKKLFTMEKPDVGLRPPAQAERPAARVRAVVLDLQVHRRNVRPRRDPEDARRVRKGVTQETCSPKIIGRSLPQFSTEFFAWSEQQVRDVGVRRG
jgi:hypothetical protein